MTTTTNGVPVNGAANTAMNGTVNTDTNGIATDGVNGEAAVHEQATVNGADRSARASDTAYEIELDEQPPAAAPVSVDTTPGRVGAGYRGGTAADHSAAVAAGEPEGHGASGGWPCGARVGVPRGPYAVVCAQAGLLRVPGDAPVGADSDSVVVGAGLVQDGAARCRHQPTRGMAPGAPGGQGHPFVARHCHGRRGVGAGDRSAGGVGGQGWGWLLLAGAVATGVLVFASETGTELDASNVRRAFRRVVKAAGLNPWLWTPRELRHSFVSLLSDASVPIEVISRLVGHSSTDVTEKIYRHQIRPVVEQGADAMDRIFPTSAA